MCILFGLFVFTIMCEQITSITSVKLKLTTSFETSTNELMQHYQQQLHNQEICSRSSKLITQIKKLYYLFESLKYNSYFNYEKFKMVFKTNNPLLWLIPFEMESIIGRNKDIGLYNSNNKFTVIDKVIYENV
jgi:hypothetical protein